jgi:hypothetical protein
MVLSQCCASTHSAGDCVWYDDAPVVSSRAALGRITTRCTMKMGACCQRAPSRANEGAGDRTDGAQDVPLSQRAQRHGRALSGPWSIAMDATVGMHSHEVTTYAKSRPTKFTKRPCRSDRRRQRRQGSRWTAREISVDDRRLLLTSGAPAITQSCHRSIFAALLWAS